MKRSMLMGVVVWLSLLAGAGAAELQLTVEVPRPQTRLDERGFSHVEIPGYLPWGQPGAPELPARLLYLALPPGEQVTSLEVHPAPARSLPGRHRLFPRQRPWPFSRGPAPFQAADQTAFRAAAAAPLVSTAQPQLLRGFAVLPVMVRPLRYQAASGTLDWYPRIAITITTGKLKGNPPALPGYRGLERDFSRVRHLVANPRQLDSYPRAKAGRDPDYRYLVITSQALADCPGPDNLQALLADKEARGISTRLETVANIRASYQGRDDAEKIRAFITDMYQNHSADFVLLAGDADLEQVGGETEPVVVPVRGLWGDIGYGEERNIPSDRYYACLDGDYDADGDGLFGESNDQVDTLGEVWVGRVAADSCGEVANFVHKTLAYQASSGDWLRDVYMVGEVLFEDYYGADDLEHVHNSSTRNGYSTKGFSESNFFNVHTMYDKDLGDEGWGPAEILALLNGSHHVFNHLGHSITYYNMRLMTDDIISGLHNDLYFFEYTQGCYPGAFDNRLDPDSGNQVLSQDSFAEHMTLDAHGAFAVVMNTRYGLGGGYSNALHRYFWDGAFGQGMNRLGEMHGYSKDMIAGWLSDPGFRWVFYECTLFGDPELAVHLASSSSEPYLGLPAGPIQFVAIGGEGDPDSQVITVRNLGGGSLDWTVVSDQPWLTVSPESGSAPSDVTLSVDTAGLSTGAWSATLTFTAPAASNSPQHLQVQLNIIEVPATCAPYHPSAPSLDGIISAGEYDVAASVSMSVDPAHPDSSTLYLRHDGNRLYFALNIGDDSDVDDYDAVLILADNNYDGQWPATAADEGMYQIMKDSQWNAFVPIYNQGNGAEQGETEWEPAGVSAVFGNTTPRVAEGYIDLTTSHLRLAPGDTFGLFIFFYDFLEQQNDYAAVAYWPWNLSTYDTCHEFGAVTLGTENPLLVANPASLQFSAMSGGPATDSQAVIINFTGQGTADFTLTTSQPWLQLSRQDGTTPGHVEVWADPAALSQGSWSASVTVTAGGADNSPLDIPVSFEVEPPRPIIAVEPQSLFFDAVRGAQTPEAQQIAVSNVGAGTLQFSAGSEDGWLQVSPSGATAPATVSVVPLTTDLEEGTRLGHVVISTPGADPVSVTVSYRITLPPSLAVKPAQVELASMAADGAQTVELEVSTARKTMPMDWQITEDCDWLTVQPASGTAVPTMPSRVELVLDPAGLAVGVHQDVLTVTAPGADNSPLQVPISWTIQPPPTLLVEPGSLLFEVSTDQPQGTPRQLAIDNGGGGELAWTASCPAAWLNCSPRSGLAPESMEVAVDASGLEPGEHRASITVSSPGAANSPVEVAVVLQLTSPQDNQPPPRPLLLSPADGASIDIRQPALTVQNVTDADADRVFYDFELYAEGGTIPYRSYSHVAAGDAGFSYVEVDLVLEDGGYNWRARAVDEKGLASDWTESWSFTVSAPGCGCSSSGRQADAWLGLLLLLVAWAARRH